MSIHALVEALRMEAKGDWEQAHELAQEIESPEAAWVHAYLHRREGDPGNAAYWYRRAGKPVCAGPLDEERTAIEAALLQCGDAGKGSH